jgi:multiple sugar transport system ATP-binding protein
MASVTLESLTKKYGGVVAVRGVDLTVEDRELVVLVGPSGCGKSTTLRLVAGLEAATTGTIRIGGRIVNQVPPQDRNISMVFQNDALYPHRNVYRNLGFGLEIRKVRKAEIDQRVRRAAALLRIEDLLERRPAELSGGQRQRVAVGRAIVRDPDVFLFDEPLSHLDAGLRVTMRSELVKLQRRLEATMIHVTHDQVEAMAMASRVVVMNEGRIQQTGSPASVYGSPVNRFVAGFIGSPPMNFFSGLLVAEDGGLQVDFRDFRLAVPPERGGRYDSYIGKEVTLGLRPEDMIAGTSGRPEAVGTRAGAQVVALQLLGAETLLELKRGDVHFTVRVNSHCEYRPGQKVEVDFNMSKCHLFDRVTGGVI